MENTTGNIKGALFIAAAAICWGIFPAISRFLYSNGADPITAAMMRALVCAIIYIGMGIVKGAFKTLNIKECIYFFIMGMFTVVGMYVFYMVSLDEVSTAIAAMLLYTAPAFVIIFNRLFYKEPITRGKIICLAVTFIGCAFVVEIYDIDKLKVNALGVIFGLLSGICYSMVTVFGKRMLKIHSAETTAIMPTLFGALVLMCIKPVWKVEISSVAVFAAYVALGIVGSVIPNLLYNKGLAQGIDGGKASIIATLEPVIATITGALIYGDDISFPQIFGILMVVGGAVMSILNESSIAIKDS